MSPSLLGLHSLQDVEVVVGDIFRATSTITTALAHGVKQVVAVDTWERCAGLRDLGFKTAGEREGIKIEGCDVDNSPMAFQNDQWNGEKLALTTSNGTQCIVAARAAKALYIGCFLNLSCVIQHANRSQEDILLLCAGQRGSMSPEDTLWAGAVAYALRKTHQLNDEAKWAAEMYQRVQKDILSFLTPFAHTQQLLHANKAKEVELCLSQDVYDILPCYRNGYIEEQ